MKNINALYISGIFLACPMAHADTFPNGQSHYGSPAPAGSYRSVDLSQKAPINVTCGETLNFTSGGRTFAWKVSSIQHNHVPVARFAPPGFDTQGRSIFVMPAEHERGG
jgi:hypothetical protein